MDITVKLPVMKTNKKRQKLRPEKNIFSEAGKRLFFPFVR
jgi:hypothetical protein